MQFGVPAVAFWSAEEDARRAYLMVHYSLLVVLLIAERARAGIGLGMNRETKL